VSRNWEPPGTGGPLTVADPQRMMATAKATVWLSNVGGLSGLVIGEELIPGLLVFRQAARLQRRWHVEHDDVVIVMCQYGRQIMPSDGVCPSFDECLDLGFSGSSSLRYDPCSHELPISAQRTSEALPVRH
jgi:hypothetical protein